MLARALLTAAIRLVYARVLMEARTRAELMAALTVFDYSLPRRLRGAEKA